MLPSGDQQPTVVCIASVPAEQTQYWQAWHVLRVLHSMDVWSSSVGVLSSWEEKG